MVSGAGRGSFLDFLKVKLNKRMNNIASVFEGFGPIQDKKYIYMVIMVI